MLALVLFPTLGQTCDDLVGWAHPTLIRNRLKPSNLPRSSVLDLQIHQLCRRHHIVVQIRHDQKRSDDDQGDDQYTERQCHYLIVVVWTPGDMQENNKV